MSRRFFGKQIKVTVEGELRQPASFKLDDELHVVQEVVLAWSDHGFPNDGQRRHRWWQRHHRNYYHVKTADGEEYEIYHDRGTSLKHPEYRKWYITRQL